MPETRSSLSDPVGLRQRHDSQPLASRRAIVAWVNPGMDSFIETYDGTGGLSKNNVRDDVTDIDLSLVHSCPVPNSASRGAEPATSWWSTCLTSALKESRGGFNGFFSSKHGGGLLTITFSAGAEIDLDIRASIRRRPHSGVNSPAT